MSRGTRIRRNNVVVFDSSILAGGVCQDIVIVGGASTYTYPLAAGMSGFIVSSDGRGIGGAGTDTALGYPRFTFTDEHAGRVVALFTK